MKYPRLLLISEQTLTVGMTNLQDGQVTVEEFRQAIQTNCSGKGYADFPAAFKSFIAKAFKTIDVNDGCPFSEILVTADKGAKTRP